MKENFALRTLDAVEFSESIAFYSGESNELQNAEIKYQRLESSYLAYLPWVYAQQGMNVFLIQSSVIVAASVYALQSRCTPGAPQGAKVAFLQLIMYNNIMTATMALINAISMLGPAAGFANRVGKLYEALSGLYVPDSQQNMLCQIGEILSNPNEVVVENLTCATPDGSKVLFKNVSFRVKIRGTPPYHGAEWSGQDKLAPRTWWIVAVSGGSLSKPSTIGRGGMFFFPNDRI